MSWHHNLDERMLTGLCSGPPMFTVEHVLVVAYHLTDTIHSCFTWCGIIEPHLQPLITPQWSQARCSWPYFGKVRRLECEFILISKVFNLLSRCLIVYWKCFMPSLHSILEQEVHSLVSALFTRPPLLEMKFYGNFSPCLWCMIEPYMYVMQVNPSMNKQDAFQSEGNNDYDKRTNTFCLFCQLFSSQVIHVVWIHLICMTKLNEWKWANFHGNGRRKHTKQTASTPLKHSVQVLEVGYLRNATVFGHGTRGYKIAPSNWKQHMFHHPSPRQTLH